MGRVGVSPRPPAAPARDCDLCPRLVAFRRTSRNDHPDWFNAPVPSFGDLSAWLLIVGLAPGLRGANRTSRPFTGDFAGDLLYATLLRHELAMGTYGARAEDGLRLIGCRITNAVRCVPPCNKPVAAEVAACRPFLAAEIRGMPALHTILALGVLAHTAVLACLNVRKRPFPFRHGARHRLPGGLVLADSYHCSRYNTQTGRLSAAMFDDVLARVSLSRAPVAAALDDDMIGTVPATRRARAMMRTTEPFDGPKGERR